jgi:hypothetical protein
MKSIWSRYKTGRSISTHNHLVWRDRSDGLLTACMRNLGDRKAKTLLLDPQTPRCEACQVVYDELKEAEKRIDTDILIVDDLFVTIFSKEAPRADPEAP